MPNDRKTMYPDDGGLKEPVREFGEGFNAFQMIRDHFAPKDRAMTPSELLACPFCHGDPDVHDYDDDWWRVICPCTVHGPLRRTEAEAITAWNQRSTPTELGDDLVGTQVSKRSGDYEFDGHIVAVIRKKSGEVRYAVEDDRGLLLIMNAKQCGLASLRGE